MKPLLATPALRRNEEPCEAADLRPRMIPPLTQLLHQLASVIGRLSDSQYTQKPVGVIQSSVGGHVRHCLDHVRSLLSAVASGHLDYDHRQRGTAIEIHRHSALAEIAALIDELEWLPRFVITRPLSVMVSMSSDEPALAVLSSFGRELAYVLSHTIHHNAIINAMVTMLGGWVPEKFGYAPSTIRNLTRAACAR